MFRIYEYSLIPFFIMLFIFTSYMFIPPFHDNISENYIFISAIVLTIISFLLDGYK